MAETRVSQVAVEVLSQGSPQTRVSQIATEVLQAGDPQVRASQVAVEVLLQVTSVTTLTKEVTADAFVGQQSTLQVTADATVVGEFVKSVTATGLVLEPDLTKEIAADALVGNLQIDLDLAADGLVQATNTRTVTGSGVVRATLTKEITADARLVSVAVASVTADAVIIPAQEIAASALVLEAFELQVYGDALVRETNVAESTGDGYISTNETEEVDADGYLTGYASLDVPAGGLVLDTFASEVDGDAWLVEEITGEVDGDAVLVDFGLATFTADATVTGEYVTQVLAVGLVQETFDLTVTVDGVLRFLSTSELSSDGLVASITTVVREFIADASLTATPVRDVQADAIVTEDPGSGRLVAMSDGNWDNGATWRIAVAERVDGTRLIGPGYTQPFEFIPTYDTDTVAIAVAMDLSAFRDEGGDLTLTLEHAVGASWVALDSVVLTGDARAPFLAAAINRVGWFLLPVAVGLTSGDLYRVAAAGTGCNVVAGLDPLGVVVNGFVLNAVVVGSSAPAFHDGRPVLVCPTLPSGAGAVGTRAVSVRASGSVGSTVVLGPGSTLSFSPGDNVTFAVSTALVVGPGSALTIVPNPAITHVLRLGADAGMIVDGVLTMTGHQRTRYVRLAADAAPTDTTLVLAADPEDWAVGDRVFLGSTRQSESFSGVIAGINGADLTLAGTVGAEMLAASLIVNESRGAEIHGTRSRLVLRAGGAAVLDHVTLRGLGPASCLAPDDEFALTGTDVVVVDGRQLGEMTGAVGVRLAAQTTLADLTILRCLTGLVQPTGMPGPTGELVLAGFAVADRATMILDALACDITAQDIAGGLVRLAAGARFTGAVDLRWGKQESALVLVSAGMARAVEVTGGVFTLVPGENGAIVRIASECALGRIRARGLLCEGAGAWMSNGAIALGRGELIDCDLSAAPFLVLVESEAGAFVDLTHLDDAEPVVLVEGVLTPGSQVSNRDAAQVAEGIVARTTTDGFTSDESLVLTASDGQTLVWELGRVSVNAAEHVRLGLATKGAGRVRVENPAIATTHDEEVDSADWMEFVLETTVSAAGVLRVVAETEGGLKVDALQRV